MLSEAMKPPHKARVLVAIGLLRSAIILATDSDWISREIEEISARCDDLGLLDAGEYDNFPGLYLWTGTVRVVQCGSPEHGPEYDVVYRGDLEPITGYQAQLDALAMRPPTEPTLKGPE